MKRNKNLDFIKGIACILMIFAHSRGYGKTFDNAFTIFLYQVGLYAPILFLASTGISLTYQIGKKPYIRIISNYILLFMVSFANEGLRSADYINLSDWNLYACISLSAIITLLFFNFINIFTVAIPIILYFLMRNTNIGTSLFYGGLFSLIPWTSFMFLGVYLHTHKKYSNILLGLAIPILLVLIPKNGYWVIDDYNTPLYIIFGIALYSLTVISAPFIRNIKWLCDLLVYIGRNSLLFYVVHRMLIIYFPYKLYAPIVWVLLFSTTILLMPILIAANKGIIYSYSQTKLFWIIIIGSTIIPFIFPIDMKIQRALMFLILALHALNYHVHLHFDIYKYPPIPIKKI